MASGRDAQARRQSRMFRSSQQGTRWPLCQRDTPGSGRCQCAPRGRVRRELVRSRSSRAPKPRARGVATARAEGRRPGRKESARGTSRARYGGSSPNSVQARAITIVGAISRATSVATRIGHSVAVPSRRSTMTTEERSSPRFWQHTPGRESWWARLAISIQKSRARRG